MRNGFLVVGSLLPLISFSVYFRAIVRGKVRPQRMTRLLMMLIGALSFAALVAARDLPGSLLALVSFVPAIAVWVVSLRRGIGGRDWFDLICFGLCCAGVLLWLLSGRSLFGLIMSVVADLVACAPSLYKTARLPHTEIVSFYALDTVAGVCIALAATPTAVGLLYPLYIVGVNAAFVAVIAWPRRSASAR